MLLRKVYEKLKHKYWSLGKPIIVSRSVCLGTWAFDRIDIGKMKLFNCGKNRVDYALDMHKDKSQRADAFEISKYTPRDYRSFRGWYWAEEQDLFKHKKVKAFVMDSFSELVDQRFISKKNGHSFCTIYRAVKGTKLCDLYDCLGLLDIDLIKKYYLAFFKELRKVYEDIPIVFIHFSTVFETRENFIARAVQIEKAIDEINREENMGIIQIKPRIIEHHETDPNAYHYSKNTYDDVAVQLVEALKAKGVHVKLKNEINQPDINVQ